MTIAVFLGSLLLAMASSMPIAFALLASGVALMWQLDLFDAQILIGGADSFPLLAVPFFMLAGEIMNTGGLSRRIVNLALALVGHVRGGLGYVTIMAGCLLSALSGSAVADAAALTALLLPMMVAAGHDKARAGGLITVADLPSKVVEMLRPFMGNQILVMAVGTAMDMIPTILILTPVLMPVVKAAGIDPVYFGVMFIINNSIGLITPPVGVVLNVVAGVGRMKMDDVTRGVLPFMAAEFAIMFVMVLFPQLVTVPARWFHG